MSVSSRTGMETVEDKGEQQVALKVSSTRPDAINGSFI